jgi:hypothetical protein
MVWRVEITDQCNDWLLALGEKEQDAILAAIEVLEAHGPGLGRPLVDTVKGSAHANMKELRPPIGNIRILFAFDPMRTAILLIGGDKTNRWMAWYKQMIPLADRIYDEHLARIRNKGTKQ